MDGYHFTPLSFILDMFLKGRSQSNFIWKQKISPTWQKANPRYLSKWKTSLVNIIFSIFSLLHEGIRMIIISIFLSNVHVIFTRVSNPEPNQLHNGVLTHNSYFIRKIEPRKTSITNWTNTRLLRHSLGHRSTRRFRKIMASKNQQQASPRN